jgi:peptidoglycan/xylan/chitin deacetylase (PgdA/CDA1 family)
MGSALAWCRRYLQTGDQSETKQANTHRAGGALPRVRAALRSKPRLQGMALAPMGTMHRLPREGGIFFPFYHGVAADDVRYLRRHLRAFAARGRFISWDDALAALENNGDGDASTDQPRFCLSFDDGHKDWLHVLLPVLHEFEAPATFFITVNNVTSATESRGRLTWADCRRLVDEGMGVGSHTISHPRLAVVDTDRARREVFGSKAVLEDRLGIDVRDFAAPYGLPGIDYLLERDVELTREAGYRCLATARRGAMHPGDCPYLIRRSGLNSAWPLLAVRSSVHGDRSARRPKP